MPRYHKSRRRKGALVRGLVWVMAVCWVGLGAVLVTASAQERAAQPEPTVPEIRRTCREVYTQTIPFRTVYIRDDTLPPGMEQERSPGRDGELLCTAQVEYLGSREEIRCILEQETLSQPQNRLVAQGPMPELGTHILGDGFIRLPDGTHMTYTRTAAFTASGYTHTDPFRSTVTALDTPVHTGTLAANPTQIPYGTRLYVMTHSGTALGIFRVEDSLVGSEGTDICLYFPTTGQCMDFGIQNCIAYFLG